jgi:ABC-2 type transport system permease protein
MLFMLVMMPTIMLLILPWAATFEQKDIRLAVVDNDHSTMSKQIVEKLTASAYFDLVHYSNSYNNALVDIERGKADLILEIPQNFEKNIFREKSIHLMLNIDAVNGQKGGIALSYISQDINEYLRGIMQQSTSKIPQIQAIPQFRYNQRMEYFPYMVPGIFVILLTAMTAVLASQNIVREKEIGTIEQLNVTPMSKISFIISKVIPFWIIGIFILSIGVLVAKLMYGITPVGNLLIVYLGALIYLIALSGLGIVISNIASTLQQAMLLTFFTLMLIILLGGLFTPISSMPRWARWITIINPFRYMVEIVRLVYLKGSLLRDVLPQMCRLLGFVFLLNILAIISYKKTIK